MSALNIFCLSGVATYNVSTWDDVPIRDLPGVPDELATMRRALTSLGLVEHLPFDADERTHYDLDLGLTRGGPPTSRPWSSTAPAMGGSALAATNCCCPRGTGSIRPR